MRSEEKHHRSFNVPFFGERPICLIDFVLPSSSSPGLVKKRFMEARNGKVALNGLSITQTHDPAGPREGATTLLCCLDGCSSIQRYYHALLEVFCVAYFVHVRIPGWMNGFLFLLAACINYRYMAFLLAFNNNGKEDHSGYMQIMNNKL